MLRMRLSRSGQFPSHRQLVRVEASKPLRLSFKDIQPIPVDGCRYVDDRGSKQRDITSFQVVVRVKPDKTSKRAASCQVIIVQLRWTHGEVELGWIQYKKFGPGGLRVDTPHAE